MERHYAIDWVRIMATVFEEIQAQPAAFIQLFNTTNHWAHRDRFDGCTTPVTVLGWQRGRQVDCHSLQRVFRHLQFGRSVNRHGNVSIQRFYIYAERGLAKQRVAVWIYEDRLHVEHRQTLLAHHACRLDHQHKSLRKVSDPKLFSTAFASPQLEMFELDDEQWSKIFRWPPYAPRKHAQVSAKQLALLHFTLLSWLFLRVLR